jgi:hypothetical protein
MGFGEDFSCGGVDLFKICCANEALDQRDMRPVGCIQGEALGEDGKQAGVVGRGVLEHDVIRLEQNVDGGDLVVGCRLLGESRCQRKD